VTSPALIPTLEHRDLYDKARWLRGPWDDEPDKLQWPDAATGLPCLIVRSPLGHLCGYVGVDPGHPWHGVDYDAIEPSPAVHGGLTYSARCQGGIEPAICHEVAGDRDDVWWFGFDCAHWRDLTLISDNAGARFPQGGIYRDLAYVRAECARLAAQAAAVLETAL
jgi:hypothetical protein